MTSASAPIVVRVENRRIAMRPVISALVEAMSAPNASLDIQVIQPQNIDKLGFLDRVRSVVHGVVATARERYSAFMCAHVAFSTITFVTEDSPDVGTDVDVAIVATASHVSSLNFSVRIKPSSHVTQEMRDTLRHIEDQMRKEMPVFESVNWESGRELSRSVTETIFETLFLLDDVGHIYSNDVLQ